MESHQRSWSILTAVVMLMTAATSAAADLAWWATMAMGAVGGVLFELAQSLVRRTASRRASPA